MKKLIATFVLLLSIAQSLFALSKFADSTTRKQFIKIQTLKADTLNNKALKLAVPGADRKNLNEAINLIMKGLHIYSRYRDSTGLRETFDHLSLVYHLQKKYVQAKWFTIQSNSMARDMRDTANIIQTLLNLSSIKTDIKDYDLAKRDLDEAYQLAKQQSKINLQIDIQKAIAAFYAKTGDNKRSSIAINKILFLKDSVTRVEENRKLAALKTQLQLQQAKQQILIEQKQDALRIQGVKLKTIADQKNAVAIITLSVTAAIVFIVALFYLKRKKRRRKKRKQILN